MGVAFPAGGTRARVPQGQIEPARGPPRARAWLLGLAVVAGYGVLALAFTWPLCLHLTSRLAGDTGDNWQTLWGFEWVRRALLSGRSPFFTHDLWHPTGTTLVFQTFDLPDALLFIPLRAAFGAWTSFNLLVLGAFAGSGLAMYALGRETGASRLASFLSGCAYTFSTYHFGHALGHMHLVAMEWVPLYVIAFVHLLDQGRWRFVFAGGALLCVTSLASWYGLFDAFILSAAILGGKIVRDRGRRLGRMALQALSMCATYLVLVAPLGLAMLRERAKEPIGGAHPAWFYSADVQSFFLPNGASALAPFTSAWRAWTGNPAENATYLGYVLVALVLAGLLLRAPRVGTYLTAALLGIVLSLGPSLHVGGRVAWPDRLPYAWVVHAFALLRFTGVPVRLAFAATFGLAAALAPALDALAKRFSWKLALPLACIAVAEHVPHAFVTSSFPTPAPMVAWARDPEPFAVLDACRDLRPLWHQTLHRHPILGGYLTRTPERLSEALREDPVAGPLLAWNAPEEAAPLKLTRLDLDFSRPIVPGAEPTDFSFDVTGELAVARAGRTTFTVDSDDGAVLLVDGRLVVDDGGIHPPRRREGTVALSPGSHRVEVRYEQDGGGALLRVTWQGPGEPASVLGPPAVPLGFSGSARFHRRSCRLPRAAALAHLRKLGVRYVVVDRAESRYLLETQLGLRSIFEGAGVRIYDVPR